MKGSTLIVEANAGTGKTSLIVDRYIGLLREGYSPESIVLITFTEAAASELRERVKERIYGDLEGLKNALLFLPSSPIGTIHSFCYQLLKTFGFRYGFFDLDSTLLSDVEVEELLDFAVYEAVGSVAGKLRDFLNYISLDYIDAFNTFVSFVKEVIKHRTRYPGIMGNLDVDAMVERILSYYRKLNPGFSLSREAEANLLKEKAIISEVLSVLGKAFEIYEREKGKRLRVGYNDLLEKTLELLRGSDNARYEIAQKFRFIIVDEFQDTDPIQWEIIKEMRNVDDPPGLIIVGDPKQSIYRFRSADISIWNDAKRYVKRREELLTNYRSGGELIRFFNAVFREVYSGEKLMGFEIDFNPFAESEDREGKVTFIDFEKEEEFARKVIPEIVERSSRERVAVIARKRKDLEPYERILRENGISFDVISGNPFNTYGVREVIHLLKFIENGENRKEEFFVLTSRFVGMNHSDAIECIMGGDCPDDVKEFLRKVDDFRKRKDTELHSIFINRVLDELDYFDMLYLIDGESYYSVLELINEVARFEGENSLNFRDLISYIESMVSSRDRSLPYSLNSERGILLTTIHGSKGLEFESVVAVPWGRGFNRGRFLFSSIGLAVRLFGEKGDFDESPLFNALREVESYLDREEEKNLLYVTFTRAKRNLYVGLRRRGNEVSFPYGKFDFRAEPSRIDVGEVKPGEAEENLPVIVDFSGGDYLKTVFPSSHDGEVEGVENPYLPKGMDPRDYGNAVHYLVEAFVKGGGKEESVEYATNLIYSPNRELVKRLGEVYELLSRDYSFLIGSQTEVPFTFVDGNRVVRGRVDLIVRVGDGYEIWDVKTGMFNRKLYEGYVEQLRVYEDSFKKAGYNITSLKLFYIDENRVIDVGGSHKV